MKERIMSGDEVLPDCFCIYCHVVFADRGQRNCPECGKELTAQDHHRGWDILSGGQERVREFILSEQKAMITAKFQPRDSD
jgi:hypothetical protein